MSGNLKFILDFSKKDWRGNFIIPTTTTYTYPFDHHHHRINYNGYDVPDNKTTTDLYSKQAFTIIMNDNFHREDERLKTFEKWPLEWLDKRELAQTGMFYTGDEDKVKCYFCEVEIGRWEREDQPVPEHLRWSPNCPLLRRRTTNNVPINAEELNNLLPPISYDVCGTHDAYETRPNVYAEYPEYAIEASRERSFTDWPRHMKQTPTQMAEAGFFHSGIGDRVKCFSCGGGLKDWDESDEPWEQHAMWLPKCRFLKLMKGQSFIDAVQAKQQQQQQKSSSTTNEQQQQQQEKPNCSAQMVTNVATVATETENEIAADVELGITVETSNVETGTSREMQTQTQIQTITSDKTQVTKPPAHQQHCAATCCTTIATAATEASTSTFPKQAKMCDSTIQTTTCSVSCHENGTSNSNSNSNNNNSSNIPEEKLCKICYTYEYNTAFLPCGHVVACAKCASSVTKCPMCRKHFTDIMRVYFS